MWLLLIKNVVVSVNVLFFGGFLVIFFVWFCLMMNGWICRFEWLSLYNQSAPRIFQDVKSIYAFRNAIKTTENCDSSQKCQNIESGLVYKRCKHIANFRLSTTPIFIHITNIPILTNHMEALNFEAFALGAERLSTTSFILQSI